MYLTSVISNIADISLVAVGIPARNHTVPTLYSQNKNVARSPYTAMLPLIYKLHLDEFKIQGPAKDTHNLRSKSN